MKSNCTSPAAWNVAHIAAILILLLTAPMAASLARAAAADDTANSREDAAINQVVAGFGGEYKARVRRDDHTIIEDVEFGAVT